ncbi:MAG TPA: ComEC/Rec2 family competence protein [Hyphomicrobium sp.]|nr:ComEC/Rec2 family competence protein [Hyphomicrobium sp.]
MQTVAGAGGGGVLAGLVRRLEAEQERWFYWLPVLIGCGIGLYFALPSEPYIAAAVAPAACMLAWRAAVGRPISILAGLLIAAFLAAALGFALAKLRVEFVRAPVLTKQLNAADVRGWVELVEPRPKRGQRLTLRVASIGSLAADATPVRVRITTVRAVPELAPGSFVRLRATLMPPSAPAMPGDYDFGRQAWFRSLGAVGYTLSRPQIEENTQEALPLDLRLWARVERVRQEIGARIAEALPGERGAIATALITGERGGISEATNDAFRDSGIVHILSISGLHMAIMAGAVFFSVRFLLALFPAIALRYPIKKWAAAAAMVGALCYLLISGGAFATVRSAIMVTIMFFAVLLDRPALALRNVVLTAAIILIVYPESLLDVGFQMSFAAVLALVSIYEALQARPAWLTAMRRSGMRVAIFFGGIVLSTLIASAAVAPFSAYHFHQSQQYAVLANLVALPVCDIIVMPAALAALVVMPLGLEVIPLSVMGWGIDAMVWVAFRVAELPGAVINVPAIPTIAFLLMVAGGLWLVLWQTRWRLAGFAVIAAGIALAPTLRMPDLLIGRDGALVAVRGAGGELSAIGASRSSFELQRWVEHDGWRSGIETAVRGATFNCDGIACAATVSGIPLAVVRHPAAFAEDCRRAGILVSELVSPRDCTGPKTVVDFFAARRQGAHAIYIDPDGTIRVETVAGVRGMRPWSMPPERRPRTGESGVREVRGQSN